MRILSFNVNGLSAYMKYIRNTHHSDFSTFLSSTLQVDILCIQEIRSSPKTFRSIEHFGEYTMYTNHNKEKKGYCGVSIIFKSKYMHHAINPDYKFVKIMSEYGRLIEIDFVTFKVLNIYMPYICDLAEDKERIKEINEFYDGLGEIMYKNDNMIVCGDFNAAYQMNDHYLFVRELDVIKKNLKNNVVMKNERIAKIRCKQTELPYFFNSIESLEEYFYEKYSRQWLANFVKNGGYVDSFEFVINPEQKYTCWNVKLRNREKNLGTRIDYIFVSNNIRNKIRSCEIGNRFMGSDHCPVILDIDLNVETDEESAANRKTNILSYFKI